jgi:hypothetical protein
MPGIADLEARLLASLPNVEAFEHLEVLGIDERAFTMYGPMYSYIKDIVEEHQVLPRLLDLKATFNVPDYVRRQPSEYDWLLADFIKVNTAQKVQRIFDQNVERHADDPQTLVASLRRDLDEIAISEKRDVSVTDASAAKRMAGYAENRLEEGWLAGIPTGLSYFDAALRMGWDAGELIGLVARTTIGKSWIMLYFGLVAWTAGKHVLFLSPELPEKELEARWDTLMCGMNDIATDALDYYRGFLPSKEQVEMAMKASKRQDWTTLCSVEGRPFSINEIPRLVARYEPDLVLIDGLNFVQGPTRGRQSWERIMDVSYGLKTTAVGANVAIIVSHQANRAAAHNLHRPPALHEIFAGDGFAQACDRLLVLHPPQQPPHRLVVTIQKFRRGEPQQGGLMLQFEPGKGKINEVFDTKPTRNVRPDGSDVQSGKGDARSVSIP